MSLSVLHLLTFLLPFGALGLFLLSVADDSFLFLPIGSDLVTVILVARHHNQLLICMLAGAAGSTIGVLLLDLVCRKGGEKGLGKLVKPKLLASIKQKMERHAAGALIVACLAPPPFPFGVYIAAAASAFQFPRVRLLTIVFLVRTVRYALVGWAAIHFGRRILRIANSTEFLWFVGGFIALCLIGSIISVVRWVRISRDFDSIKRSPRSVHTEAPRSVRK